MPSSGLAFYFGGLADLPPAHTSFRQGNEGQIRECGDGWSLNVVLDLAVSHVASSPMRRRQNYIVALFFKHQRLNYSKT